MRYCQKHWLEGANRRCLARPEKWRKSFPLYDSRVLRCAVIDFGFSPYPWIPKTQPAHCFGQRMCRREAGPLVARIGNRRRPFTKRACPRADTRDEEALRVSERRYRRLFEAARDGILILEVDTGTISDVNPFLTEMLGYSHTELVGTPIWELGPFKGHHSQQGQVRATATTGVYPLRKPAAGSARWPHDCRGVCQQRLSGGERPGHPM